jgi:hypothetical protein
VFCDVYLSGRYLISRAGGIGRNERENEEEREEEREGEEGKRTEGNNRGMGI